MANEAAMTHAVGRPCHVAQHGVAMAHEAAMAHVGHMRRPFRFDGVAGTVSFYESEYLSQTEFYRVKKGNYYSYFGTGPD